jgi:hypothetical protein
VPRPDVGSTIELSFNGNTLRGKITEPHDPRVRGAAHDRLERQESYVKDFKPLTLGGIRLQASRGTLTLRALSVPGRQAMDLRLLTLKRSAD